MFRVSMQEMLAAGSPLLTQVIEVGPCDDGEYFLDRDGTYFHYTLDYIRQGRSALASEGSSGGSAVHVSYEVRRRLLLEAKVLGLSDMQASLEEISDTTPQTSSSGREARDSLMNSYSESVTRSENDLPFLEDGARRENLAKCLACCNPIAITYIPPERRPSWQS